MNSEEQITADEALQRLIDGNRRFVSGQAHVANQSREALAELAHGQQPFATILGCSDSRVSPEWIFDAWLGELFVIRVAGNVLSPEVAGSLQYAGSHLGTPLFIVLGHEGCGAVSAALQTKHQGASQRSRIQLVVDNILPALDSMDPELPFPTLLSQAVERNVRWSIQKITESPEGQARLAEGRMKILGAIYDLETGRVKFLDEIR